MEVDPYINFADYDNLNGNSPGSDGKVDFVYIIYRNIAGNTLMNYTGIARLNVSTTINVDGKQIVDNSYIGGGVQQRGGYNGRDYTLYVAAHEMGHYLFGGNHINSTTNLCLMSGSPVWNGSRGMHSWERQRLGWISYTDKSTDGSVTMSDYMTADQVYRVPGTSSEYFLIENRKKISPHDKAGDNGFYFYRITNATSFPPTIDVLCADGNWDFVRNTSTQTLTRTTPNPTGSDEMSYSSSYGGVKYACYTPVYFENSAWGDTEDAFDLTFNNVLSPASNPRSTNTASLNFSIEVTGTNTIQFFFTSPYAGSPSKPQNLQVAWDGNHPKLTWLKNGESDMQSYKISKMIEGQTGWATVATVNHNSSLTIHNWTDINVSKPGIFDPIYSIHYKIRAFDNQSKYSVYSEEKEIDAYTNYFWKLNEENNDASEVVLSEYSLNQNYPNPFNPTTTISYILPKDGYVTLKVYNSLGQQLNDLVSSYQSSGSYTVQFDGGTLSSGIYYYKLQCEEFSQINKMLLLK